MGMMCVKDEQSPFCSTAATSSSRPRALQDDARRSSQGRPFRAAAQRLGLELSEHVIMLGPSGTIGAPRVGGSVRASAILAVAIQGSSRFGDLGCLPDQTHIRSSREATAPGFRLRRCVNKPVSLFFAIQGSSLFRRSGLAARSNSHSVVARGDRTRIPLATGRLERTGPFFVAAFEAKQSIGSSTRIGRD